MNILYLSERDPRDTNGAQRTHIIWRALQENGDYSYQSFLKPFNRQSQGMQISNYFNCLKVLYRKLRKFYFAYVKAWFVYRKTKKWQILDNWETIDYLLSHHCSLSRFGDGEFSIMRGEGNGFQKYDRRLAERLVEVILDSTVPNHMIAIPLPMKDLSGLVKPHNFWPVYTSLFYKELKNWISLDRVYLNTQVTRFYYEREDKSRCAEHLTKLKKLWEKRDVVIVEGCLTRSGIGNDLYDNASSIRRIVGFSENAFSHYEEMLNSIIDNVDKKCLILLCYGMTATVLAYDLTKLGYWAIDIGHLDIEYEWMKMGTTELALVKGKHVNELKEIGGSEYSECEDPIYLSQIICDITKF